jgi:hypothetical protein
MIARNKRDGKGEEEIMVNIALPYDKYKTL